MSEKVDARQLLPATANLFCFGVILSGLATLLSAGDRYRWRTIGIVTAFFVVQMIIKVIAVSADELHWLIYFTFMGAYEPLQLTSVCIHEPHQLWSFVITDADGRWIEPGPLGSNLTLLLLGGLSYAASFLVFLRRDLPAPI